MFILEYFLTHEVYFNNRGSEACTNSREQQFLQIRTSKDGFWGSWGQWFSSHANNALQPSKNPSLLPGVSETESEYGSSLSDIMHDIRKTFPLPKLKSFLLPHETEPKSWDKAYSFDPIQKTMSISWILIVRVSFMRFLVDFTFLVT